MYNTTAWKIKDLFKKLKNLKKIFLNGFYATSNANTYFISKQKKYNFYRLLYVIKIWFLDRYNFLIQFMQPAGRLHTFRGNSGRPLKPVAKSPTAYGGNKSSWRCFVQKVFKLCTRHHQVARRAVKMHQQMALGSSSRSRLSTVDRLFTSSLPSLEIVRAPRLSESEFTSAFKTITPSRCPTVILAAELTRKCVKQHPTAVSTSSSTVQSKTASRQPSFTPRNTPIPASPAYFTSRNSLDAAALRRGSPNKAHGVAFQADFVKLWAHGTF
jgi:hypothetical protein